jgi:iron complex outermembrane receptor protein
MRLSVAVALCGLCTISFAAEPAYASIRKDTHIPAEELGPALQTLAKDYDFQVLYRTEIVKDLKTNGAAGSLTSDEALSKVLSGTGLTYKYLDSQTVTVIPLAFMAGADAAETGQNPPSDQRNEANSSKEGKKSSSKDFRVAQVGQGQTTSNVSVDNQNEQDSKKKRVQLEEVVVTGSRLPQTTREGAQDVQVYTRENIEQSGQTNVADFLNTLPSVSIAVVPSGVQTAFGGTTVQLRGLPLGTTLVLINGRRVQTSGSQAGQDFFDLNNIPLAAVERIEIVADGSSAVYGSDAIAGVVNVILKKSFDGFEANAKYGAAADMHEWDGSLAWGKRWDKGSFSIIGSYQAGSELEAGERKLTGSEDYTAFGGPNNNISLCHPGNVFSANGSPLPGAPPGSNATFAAVSGNIASGRPTFGNFTYGALNNCFAFGSSDLIPATRRTGIFAQGSYQLAPFVELFTELMYSHIQEYRELGPQYLFGVPGFQSFTVSASNPYNPFGATVGISDVFNSITQGQFAYTDFYRPLVGARGSFSGAWQWELSAWDSQDSTDQPNPNAIANNTAIQSALDSSNPATALNPFIAGPAGSQMLLTSLYSASHEKFLGRSEAVSGFVRGPLLKLPSGPIELVVGSEYDRDTLSANVISSSFGQPLGESTFHRTRYAAFGEVRVPILANRAHPEVGDTLALTAAYRYDHYSDFGSTTNPQFGAEWRPFSTLLVRATYADAFKAPSLYELYSPQTSFQSVTKDPVTGQTLPVTEVQGGNPSLRPQAGRSYTFGFVYSSEALRGLRLSITDWNVEETNAIQSIPGLFILDNPSLFPGHVIRDSNGTLTEIIDTEVNFGKYDIAGLDYQLSYRYPTVFGVWTPSLSASQTYRYTATLLPGTPPVDRVSSASDDLNWAPRWKGTAALGWTLGPYTANLDGRYVGKYRDYDPLPNGSYLTLGNFWLCDANFRYAVGHALAPQEPWTQDLYLEVGGVNLFNTMPQFSNLAGGFAGYDPTQADIRGRFLYVRMGAKW